MIRAEDLRGRIRAFLPYAPDLSGYDLAYRPRLYWNQPGPALRATVLPEHLRAREEAGLPSLPSASQKFVEAIHPAFMGGATCLRSGTGRSRSPAPCWPPPPRT